MGLWRPPEKVRLPGERDLSPSLFEYNGHLPDGTQLLAYDCPDPKGDLPPDESGRRGFRFLGVVHEFDADGHHRLIRTRVTAGRFKDGLEAGEAARAMLREMVAPYLSAGWRPGDIWVRPFLVKIDGWSHGFVFKGYGLGLEDGSGEAPDEAVYFKPFDFPFHPPYDSGSYST
jgi:hypothetical protein